jgi:hypothetical protein
MLEQKFEDLQELEQTCILNLELEPMFRSWSHPGVEAHVSGVGA